jgi:hypothetical protein
VTEVGFRNRGRTSATIAASEVVFIIPCNLKWRMTLIMRHFTSALSIFLLGFCFLVLPGCGEDNEAAIKEQATKSTGTVDASKAIAPSQNMADYAKNNPGMNPAASSGKAAPAAKK